jgi:hypothetical protein
VESRTVARKLDGRPLLPPLPPGSGIPQRSSSRSRASTFLARSTSSKSTPFFDSSSTEVPPLRNSFLTRQMRCGPVSNVNSITGFWPPVQGTYSSMWLEV